MSHMLPRSPRRGGGLLAVGVLALAIGLAMPSTPASATEPPGNNGTVKVDDLDMDRMPNNQPHVSCEFTIEWRGYDEGDLDATVTFELQPPTVREGDDQVLLTDTVAIGEDPAGGANDLDAREVYTLDLTGVDPLPHQGVHVKLTVHAEGSQGADTKYKVFWVGPCGPDETTTTQPARTTTTRRQTTTTGLATTTSAAPTTTSPVATTAAVLPTQITRAPETTATTAATAVKGVTLARTGSPVKGLLLAAGLLLLAGGALTAATETSER